MSNGYSLTQGANLTTFAGALVIILRMFGVDLPAADVATLLAALAIFIGPIMSWIGRYRVGDLNLGGTRK